jgi:hypothetical protein
MPQDTHETTPTHFAEAGGIRFAYRRFGRRGGTPLLLLNYFAANLDNWDPKVTNGFAAERDVIPSIIPVSAAPPARRHRPSRH